MLCNSVVDLDNLTYPSVFKAYAELGLCKNGAQLHGRVLKIGLLFAGVSVRRLRCFVFRL
ncbi:hypothetical protein Hanom_Chr14g01325951 [Helianthus anomalus]